MLEPVSMLDNKEMPPAAVLPRGQIRSARPNDATVQQEFMAIFYKELLKKAIKPPSFGDSSSQDSMINSFTGDLLVSRLALQLAKSQAFSAEQLFGASSPIGKGSK